VDNYPLLNLFLTMLYLFLWVAWILLVFRIVTDIFRSDDLSGWGKAAWTVLILILPWLGTLIYLVVRGGGMYARDVRHAQATRRAMTALLDQGGESGSSASTAEELRKLADLRSSGVLTDQEFEAQKAKLLS
jgi:Short C-terminal domain/Phospholipase_D-nuclease N-terminal